MSYYTRRVIGPGVERAIVEQRAKQAACPHDSTGLYLNPYSRSSYRMRCMTCRLDIAAWDVVAGDFREIYHFQNPPRRPSCSALTSG